MHYAYDRERGNDARGKVIQDQPGGGAKRMVQPVRHLRFVERRPLVPSHGGCQGVVLIDFVDCFVTTFIGIWQREQGRGGVVILCMSGRLEHRPRVLGRKEHCSLRNNHLRPSYFAEGG